MQFLTVLRLTRLTCATLATAGVVALCAPMDVYAQSTALLQQSGQVASLAPVLKQVTPGVVNISVRSRSPEEDNPMLQDPFFRRFFGVPERPPERQSAGSGVIVDAAKGYVLTNHHVIANATQVTVTLTDRRDLTAKIVGSDPATDIALLQVPAQSLTAVRLGDSEQLQVGDFVLAIGNPFGLGQTVTSGIVSALGRTGLNETHLEDFIQTDAAINPGNSGGALINLKGELVGINSAIIGPAGGNVGIGFAVPVNMARSVMAQLAQFGEVKRGRLGVSTGDITPELAKSLNVRATEGAIVAQIDADSPAEKAGLKRGDVVTAMNGRPIRTSSELRNRVGLTPVGEEVRLTVLREGREQEVRTKVEAPSKMANMRGEAIAELPGATLATLDARRARVEGVYVADVDQRGPAWQVGLREGDVILGANNRRTANVAELRAALRANSNTVVLHLLRGDTRYDLRFRRR